VSHDPSRGCQDQKLQVPLEVGGASVHGERAYVEMGLTEGHRSSFEQSDPRAPSILKKKDTTEMMGGTPGTVALELITK
jgi:hypothetical protein